MLTFLKHIVATHLVIVTFNSQTRYKYMRIIVFFGLILLYACSSKKEPSLKYPYSAIANQKTGPYRLEKILRDSLNTLYKEDPAWWIDIANDTSYNPYHRGVCAQLFFKRHVMAGTKLNELFRNKGLKNCPFEIEFIDAYDHTLNPDRVYEYQDTAKSYVGFRGVMTYLGRGQYAFRNKMMKIGASVYKIAINPGKFNQGVNYPCTSFHADLAFKMKTSISEIKSILLGQNVNRKLVVAGCCVYDGIDCDDL